MKTMTIYIAKSTLSRLAAPATAGEQIIIVAREGSNRQHRALPHRQIESPLWRIAGQAVRRSNFFSTHSRTRNARPDDHSKATKRHAESIP